MVQSTPPGLEGLVDLACRDGVDIRPTLLRVLTDLYVQKPVHTPEEETHYVELAQRLFATVDAPTKASVTARLMAYGNVPNALAHHLEIRPLLPAATAPEQVSEATKPAVAPTVDASVEDKPEPAPTIVPETVPVQQSTEQRARELTEIFFSADPAERRLILTNLDEIAVRHVAPINKANDIIRHLESAALRHDAGAFARELVGRLGINREIADRIVEDPSGEPLLIVGRIFEMPAAMLQRVLLFLNPTVGQSVQRVYELAALYGQITRPAAAHLLSIFRMASAADHPSYQSVLYQSTLWNDEALTAREAATPHVKSDADRGVRSAPLAKVNFG
jgi:hypothetical protein